MLISYNKLWKLMIDYSMNKTQLRKAAGLSTNVIARLSKNDTVSMDSLLRICGVLRCNVGDIVDVIEESEQIRASGYPFGGELIRISVAENSNSGYKNK